MSWAPRLCRGKCSYNEAFITVEENFWEISPGFQVADIAMVEGLGKQELDRAGICVAASIIERVHVYLTYFCNPLVTHKLCACCRNGETPWYFRGLYVCYDWSLRSQVHSWDHKWRGLEGVVLRERPEIRSVHIIFCTSRYKSRRPDGKTSRSVLHNCTIVQSCY